MPKIPQYQSYGNVQQQLPTNIYSNINVSPNDLGAGMYMQLGEAISRTSNIASQQLLQYAEEGNKNKARESLNTANQEMRDFYNSAMQRHPKDNANFHAELTAKSKEIFDKTTKNLGGGARQYFTSSYTDLTDQYLNKGLQFQTEQQGKYKLETLTAQNQQAFNDVYAGVIPMDTALNIVKANSTEMYKNLSPEGLKLAVQNDVDKAYIQYASGLAKRNPQEALDYITFNKEQMNPVTADKALFEFEKVNKDYISKNSAVSTDKQLVIKLNTMSANDLIKEDLTKYKDSLNGSDYSKFVNLQKSLKGGDTEAYRSREPYSIASQRIKDIIKDPKELEHFYQKFDEAVNTLPKDKRDNDNIGKILDKLMTPTAGGKYYFQNDYLTGSEKEEAMLSEPLRPENLKGVKGLNYHAEEKAFSKEYENVLYIYDEKGKVIDKKPIAKDEQEQKKEKINEMKFKYGARY